MLRILFVDDEQKILDGLKRILRPLRHEWNCEFTNQGAAALQMLDQKKFDVVVTDMRMPAMDGLELLKQVKTRYPHLLRIVLSGQSEMEKLTKSSGVSHQYLAKPCGLENLKSAITRALTLKQLLSEPTLIELASKVDTIQMGSPVYLELESLLYGPVVDMDRISDLIVKDVGMCAKVLQLANAGEFALMEPVSDPAYAVGLLGFTTLQSLCTANQAIRNFDSTLTKESGIGELWKHSFQCSLLAQEIARALAPDCQQTQNQARVAGLLHDVGCLVMAYSLSQKYQEAVALAAAENLHQVEAERRIFQSSHAELGAYIMALWSLPDPIVNAIAYHHNPSASPEGQSPVLTAVHVAEALASPATAQIDYSYLDSLGLTERLDEWQAASSEIFQVSGFC